MVKSLLSLEGGGYKYLSKIQTLYSYVICTQTTETFQKFWNSKKFKTVIVFYANFLLHNS